MTIIYLPSQNPRHHLPYSAKEAKANKIFGWVSFGVGTLIGIAGIVLGIIF